MRAYTSQEDQPMLLRVLGLALTLIIASLQSAVAAGPAETTKALIDALARIEHPHMGYTAHAWGTIFLPLERYPRLWRNEGGPPNARSAALEELVRRDH